MALPSSSGVPTLVGPVDGASLYWWTMEKVQKIDRSNTAPSSKTFRDEQHMVCLNDVTTQSMWLCSSQLVTTKACSSTHFWSDLCDIGSKLNNWLVSYNSIQLLNTFSAMSDVFAIASSSFHLHYCQLVQFPIVADLSDSGYTYH
jgi:hypothetical protein